MTFHGGLVKANSEVDTNAFENGKKTLIAILRFFWNLEQRTIFRLQSLPLFLDSRAATLEQTCILCQSLCSGTFRQARSFAKMTNGSPSRGWLITLSKSKPLP